ncbi:MAG: MFS transporter [Deltaproteobacteria bacterium]|nr:MFS transporter [Deltaproteobacteria bacterium]MBW2363126.1 MFS transporter [Deltaproteobacteria bacterium]
MQTETPAPSRPAATGGLADAVETFRLPLYARLWTSNLIQFTCFQVLGLAMQWLVTSLTPSRSALGFVGFVQGGTSALVSPVAGVIVDRYAKRSLIVLGRVGLASVGLCVAWLVWSGSVAYWHLLVAALVGGVLASVLQPATQTFVVDVVGRRRTEHAVALNAMGSSFGSMGGGALAGVLVGGIGMMATYSIASAGLLVAAFLVISMRIRGPRANTERSSPWADLREGFAYVRARPPLLLAMLGCSMALFNGAITPMRPVFARHVLGVGATEFGVLSAVHGVGTFAMAIAITLRPPRRNLGILIVGSMLAFAIGLLLYSFAFSYAWALAVELWLGCAGQLWNVAAITGFQLAVPEEMRGRVLSMVFTLAQLGFVGVFAVGALADAVGDQLALGLFGAIPTLLLTLLLTFGWRVLKRM